MSALQNHRTWLTCLLVALALLATPLFVPFKFMTTGFVVLYVLVWLCSVGAFVGLIKADTRLAKAVGVNPPMPIWLLYALGLWPIGTLWLDICGMRTSIQEE